MASTTPAVNAAQLRPDSSLGTEMNCAMTGSLSWIMSGSGRRKDGGGRVRAGWGVGCQGMNVIHGAPPPALSPSPLASTPAPPAPPARKQPPQHTFVLALVGALERVGGLAKEGTEDSGVDEAEDADDAGFAPQVLLAPHQQLEHAHAHAPAKLGQPVFSTESARQGWSPRGDATHGCCVLLLQLVDAVHALLRVLHHLGKQERERVDAHLRDNHAMQPSHAAR